MCEAVAAQDHEVQLHVLDDPSRHENRGFSISSYAITPWLPAKLYWSETMRSALKRAALSGQIMHSHGMWIMPTLVPYFCVRGTSCRLVVSPRGTLDPADWNFRPLRKRVAWHLGQRTNLDRAAALHATAELELKNFRALGLRTPVAIIPNGVDVLEPSHREGPPMRERVLLFLARIHPKKGLDVLLRAWQRVQGTYPDWSLKVVGYARDPVDYMDRMKDLARTLGLERVDFVGKVSEEDKLLWFRSSALYVLPTRGDNWANTISQALAAGTPVITTKNAPWSGLANRRCGWWIDDSVDALIRALQDALARDPNELVEMGSRGCRWMADEYSWRRVGEMTSELYRWVVTGGTRPDFVVLD
jgi:glycosyltransferase involved in cell wall biosynthesis